MALDPPLHLDDHDRMRAVSHPARWRMLQELWAGRTLTSTAAAELVDLSPSAMSYHLRRLAALGLVEQTPSADGRERPWRATTDGLSMTGQPDPALGGLMMQNFSADVSRALATPPPAEGDPRPWPASFGHRRVRMTRAEAKELSTRLTALLAEAEAAGAARAEAPQDPAPEDEPVFRYDLFWATAAADGEAGEVQPDPRRADRS
ncbi:ArsR/SmtB family transcription factor [Brachybacterium sp. AOP42-C2-15]|uniref:ArsR/SmtB family transcription factor n=1 Tax=unclassified Brachybacterium TaxID=2623841 RepID=UPI003F9131E3